MKIITAICFLSVIMNDAACQRSFGLIDKKATQETIALYKNLHEISEKQILFGHQHATEYGHGWRDDENRSDVKSVTGSHPAVIGVDFSGLSGVPEHEIEYHRKHLKKIITDTYNRGGVVTVSWHFNNPIAKGGFYWVDSLSKPAMKYFLSDENAKAEYKNILKEVANLAKSCRGQDGNLVPMIFRPYHEMDGDWFWWGAAHVTPAEFKNVWKMTVSYLRDSLDVHNFIYAFSPDNMFNSEEEFLLRYPGDEWVDMIGMDNYGDFGRYGKYDLDAGFKKLKIVSDLAIKKNKLAAFTETGLESVVNEKWWTEVLLKTLQREKLKLTYVLVWRNDQTSPTHYYAPFPGHPSVPDFLSFYNDKYTLFENDLKNIYR